MVGSFYHRIRMKLMANPEIAAESAENDAWAKCNQAQTVLIHCLTMNSDNPVQFPG